MKDKVSRKCVSPEVLDFSIQSREKNNCKKKKKKKRNESEMRKTNLTI